MRKRRREEERKRGREEERPKLQGFKAEKHFR
jgi:hypothetical protein